MVRVETAVGLGTIKGTLPVLIPGVGVVVVVAAEQMDPGAPVVQAS